MKESAVSKKNAEVDLGTGLGLAIGGNIRLTGNGKEE